MRLTGTKNGRDWLITNKITRYGRIPLSGSRFIARVGGEPEVKILGSVKEARAYINKVLSKPVGSLSSREKEALTWRK